MRGKLGKDCTYLAFEKEGDLFFLCAKLKNELGGTDKVKQKINVLSNYDVELVDHNNNMTNIMIPKEEKHIQNTNYFTFEEYLELNW